MNDYTARLDALDEAAAEWERLDAGTPQADTTEIPY